MDEYGAISLCAEMFPCDPVGVSFTLPSSAVSGQWSRAGLIGSPHRLRHPWGHTEQQAGEQRPIAGKLGQLTSEVRSPDDVARDEMGPDSARAGTEGAALPMSVAHVNGT
jgi:hypothetical protein